MKNSVLGCNCYWLIEHACDILLFLNSLGLPIYAGGILTDPLELLLLQVSVKQAAGNLTLDSSVFCSSSTKYTTEVP